MAGLFHRRATAVWLLLILATAISWGATHDGGRFDMRAGTVAALVMAFVKVRFVVLDFMELRTAPLPYRLFFEAWIVGVGGAIILLIAGG